MKRVIKGAIALSLAGAAIFTASGTANAYYLNRTFQTTWTRDATWDCGATGYTGGVYYQPCTRVVGGWWQSVVIVSTTSQGRYVAVDDFDQNSFGATWYDLNSKTQADGVECGYSWLNPWSSYTCWTPSIYQAHTQVRGNVSVSAGSYPNAPWVYTDSPVETTGA